MKVYILINKEGEYICKNNGRVYISNTELDKVNTYRNKKQADNIAADKRYWEYRNIDIDSFAITLVRLEYKVL